MSVPAAVTSYIENEVNFGELRNRFASSENEQRGNECLIAVLEQTANFVAIECLTDEYCTYHVFRNIIFLSVLLLDTRFCTTETDPPSATLHVSGAVTVTTSKL